jgi:hypothetical protein
MRSFLCTAASAGQRQFICKTIAKIRDMLVEIANGLLTVISISLVKSARKKLLLDLIAAFLSKICPIHIKNIHISQIIAI